MLARVLAMALCLSVCVRLSVTSRSSIETDERIELFLARELPSTHPTLCSEEIRVSSKTRVLPSGTLSQTLDFKKLLRYIDRRNVLSTSLEKGGRSERDKLDRRRSTLAIPPSSNARLLVCYSSVYSTISSRGSVSDS